MYDGLGRRVVEFPEDGHPDMCNAVMDITGDCRDEVVVWNPDEIWVYTQDDNPGKGQVIQTGEKPAVQLFKLPDYGQPSGMVNGGVGVQAKSKKKASGRYLPEALVNSR